MLKRISGPARIRRRMVRSGPFLGVSFAPITSAEAIDRIMTMAVRGERGWISTVNVAILMMLRNDPCLRRYIERSALVVADGQPIVWGSRWLATPLPSRVTGIDLIEALCDAAERANLSVFLLGGRSDVIARVAWRLRSGRPGLRLAWNDGYYRPEEGPSRAQEIRKHETDILLVGMGVPRQEQFVEQHWDTLGCSVAIGVGGSFDVLAGRRRRAPVWMQRAGLEWLYRLAQEPRRLLRRYAVTNSSFCAAYGRALVGALRHRAADHDLGHKLQTPLPQAQPGTWVGAHTGRASLAEPDTPASPARSSFPHREHVAAATRPVARVGHQNDHRQWNRMR